MRLAAKKNYWDNPQKHREKARNFYRENAEALKAYSREWSKKNPDQVRANQAYRRALKRKAGGRHTGADVRQLLIHQKGKCAYCRVKLKKYHVDHIVPITKGGTGDRRNLQILCQPCNQAKYNHAPIDFARMTGRLC